MTFFLRVLMLIPFSSVFVGCLVLFSVASRWQPTAYAAGGIDSKCSSLRTSRSWGAAGTGGGDADSLLAFVRAGPTHDSLSPFCWADKPDLAASTPHAGHPLCFNYTWEAI